MGNQIFLKSEKAFNQIYWCSSYETEIEEDYKTDDLYARREVNRFMQGRMRAILLEEYDETILVWMADIYTYLQWNDNLRSEDIVKKIAPEELYQKYSPLHEASLSNSVEKLKELYGL